MGQHLSVHTFSVRKKMKKRLICGLFTVLFAATAFGCSASDINVSFDEVKPWQNSTYEYCEYTVVKTHVESGEAVATGKYTTELSTLGDETTVKNTFTITYNNHEKTKTVDETGRYVLNAGLTDGYTSTVKFNSSSLAPGYAEKKFSIAQRPLTDGEMPERTESPSEGVLFGYTLDSGVKYGDPRGYSYTVDYSNNTAQLITEKGTTTQKDGKYIRSYEQVKHDVSVAANTRFDNEQLPFVVRALTGMRKEGSATFYLSNIYDSYLSGEYKRYTMSLSCEKKGTDFTFNPSAEKFLVTDAEGERPIDDNKKYTVPCVDAQVMVSATKSGPPIRLLITDPSVIISQRDMNQPGQDPTVTTGKVILQMVYTEYSLTSAKINYRTEYTLTDYRLNRPNAN